MSMESPNSVRCPNCAQNAPVRRDGTIVDHRLKKKPGKKFAEQCAGSNKQTFIFSTGE